MHQLFSSFSIIFQASISLIRIYNTVFRAHSRRTIGCVGVPASYIARQVGLEFITEGEPEVITGVAWLIGIVSFGCPFLVTFHVNHAAVNINGDGFERVLSQKLSENLEWEFNRQGREFLDRKTVLSFFFKNCLVPLSCETDQTKEAQLMIPKYELKAEDIRAYTMNLLKAHTQLDVSGYICTTDLILDVILKASAEGSSIEAASNDLEDAADSNTIREYLNAALDIQALREQEREMNAALAECIPDSLPRTQLEVAIDFHDEPFYGKSADLREVTCSGQAKKGTTHITRVASAYIIWRQVRLTLALRYVLPDETALDNLKILLDRLQELGFHDFRVLYLDKGFASTQIIDHLKERQQPTIIACPIRGKDGGTRALCRGRHSYRTEYTFSNGTQATLVLKATLVPVKSGKHRRKWLAFIVIELDWTPEKVRREYRRRFGIECSYRLLQRVRALTTSRNPAVRFFLLGVGIILVNAWVFLRWEFARLLEPGLRRVDQTRFRFHRFTRLLIRAIEDIYDVVTAIPASQSPQSVIY